ncbi:MAG TPA: radical SAM protein [Thermotoga sp.]|nr:Radical SAM domain protein [Thermotoga sp. Cell2]KHC92131.1 Radical SAM domain protein [Thermotoga sp. TBGT1766]HAA82947.1 radical SAM protein [Thermotoga petrophila]HBF69614.1 radical SAM protein [Thermotoga sp.]HBU00189.1 radical SAM protein [Thermotoga petrophila]
MKMRVKEINVKSALTYSESKRRYTLSPYVGCTNACVYCYASDYARRYREMNWKSEIIVKRNIAEVLRKDIIKKKPHHVFMSTMCDPYQPIEKEYKLTRRCLEVFLEFPLLEIEVMILTKSTLVLRDLDLFKKMRRISVGLSVTTDDDEIRKMFEPNASSIEERVEVLKVLKENGIRTCVFISPMLPMNPKKLASVLKPHVDCVFIDDMHYRWRVKDFYEKLGFSWALENEYFERTRKELLELFQ